MKPFAEACEQNKQPILRVLQEVFADTRQVLEIGSGTGQHAVYFSARLPHLVWQPSDVAEHLPGIRLWQAEASAANLREPVCLDVNQQPWPSDRYDGVFSANTVHIMAWPSVENMFAGIGRVLSAGGRFCLYGPFNYGGVHTSESNARFDLWLRQRDPASGVRDFEQLNVLAETAGMRIWQDVEMPVNNRLLVWEKPGVDD